MSALRNFIAGFFYLEVIVLDDDGYGIGTLKTPNSPTNGTLYTPYRLTHPVSIPALTPSVERATDRGGQKIRGEVDLGLSEFGTFDLVVSNRDFTFDAIISGSSVSTVWGGAQMLTPDSNRVTLPRLALVATLGSRSRDDSGYDAAGRLTIVYPSVTIRVGGQSGSQDGGVNPNAVTYTVTPSETGVLFNGQTFIGAAPEGLGADLESGKALMHMLSSEYQYSSATFIGNGTEDEITLPFRPLSSVTSITSPNSPVVVTVEGTRVVPSSINTTTGVVTLSTAPTAGQRVVIIYPTNFVAP
jgi:hypothetical protein